MFSCSCFFFNYTATTEIYTLSLHDALPIFRPFNTLFFGDDQVHRPEDSGRRVCRHRGADPVERDSLERSEEHTSELQSLRHLVCRLLLEKKKKTVKSIIFTTVMHKVECNTR